MPLLAYFCTVGSVLIGLLYVASAQLGPPARLSITTDFHGIPAPYKAPPSPVLTVRDAPAPDMTGTAVAQPAVAPEPETQPVKTATTAKKAKKSAKAARHNAGRNLFAETGALHTKSHRVW
jgi:hypothetical protein